MVLRLRWLVSRMLIGLDETQLRGVYALYLYEHLEMVISPFTGSFASDTAARRQESFTGRWAGQREPFEPDRANDSPLWTSNHAHLYPDGSRRFHRLQ